MIGRARHFDDAASQSVTIGDRGFPQGAAPRTACAWARSDDLGNGFYWYVSYGRDDAGAFSMGRHGTALWGGDRSDVIVADSVFALDEWRYTCCVYDGSVATVHIDGRPVIGPEPHRWSTTAGTANIGTYIDSPDCCLGLPRLHRRGANLVGGPERRLDLRRSTSRCAT